MRYLKYSNKYSNFPKPLVDYTDVHNPVVVTPSIFIVKNAAQNNLNTPTEVLGIVAGKDIEVDAWWSGLTLEQKSGCQVITRDLFDIYSDRYIQLVGVNNSNKTQYQIIQDYVNGVVG